MRTDKELNKVSTALCYFLRHGPEDLGATLTIEGYIPIEEFITRLNAKGTSITHEELMRIVATDNKERYGLANNNTLIRCNQGHSTPQVDLTFELTKPPSILFHGTAEKSVASILEQGLKPMSRHYVHLSGTEETARNVGVRHGKLVLFQVRAGELHDLGHSFYLSANGVWLTDNVPVAFLTKC